MPPVADDGRGRSKEQGEDRSYEPRLSLRRVQSAGLALAVITVVGVLGYMSFEGWSFSDALYMTVITLTTVGYREVRELDASGQLWTMLLLITGVGTLFYAAVSSVELVVEGTVRGYFGRRCPAYSCAPKIPIRWTRSPSRRARPGLYPAGTIRA